MHLVQFVTAVKLHYITECYCGQITLQSAAVGFSCSFGGNIYFAGCHTYIFMYIICVFI